MNKMSKRPAVAIAATGSGRGKTTIVCALLAAYARRGLRPRAFKCGPDYIDPLFHERALGIASKNLDPFFTDSSTTRELFAFDNDAPLSIIEGVMGLYDGYAPTSDAGSTYELAGTLGSPIVLVVDARGMARSALAEIKGFLDMDARRAIVGVILNRVSASYYSILKPAIEAELGIDVLGFFPIDAESSLQSRYLGLVLPSEVADLQARIGRAADVAERCVDLDKLLAIAQERAEDFPCASRIVRARQNEKRPNIAVARDDAFCFYYADNLRLLEEAGARLVPFSPLLDRRLPDDVAGVLLGGGYPELYAQTLMENASMRASILSAFNARTPFLAECGGFMYLHERLTTEEGSTYAMVGALRGEARRRDKLVRFGYATLTENAPRFFDAPTPIRAHEFHYFDVDDPGDDCEAVKPSGKSWRCAKVDDARWLGFPHLYYASCPEFARAFVKKCVAFQARRSRNCDVL